MLSEPGPATAARGRTGVTDHPLALLVSSMTVTPKEGPRPAAGVEADALGTMDELKVLVSTRVRGLRERRGIS